jgi:hypothetical protein
VPSDVVSSRRMCSPSPTQSLRLLFHCLRHEVCSACPTRSPTAPRLSRLTARRRRCPRRRRPRLHSRSSAGEAANDGGCFARTLSNPALVLAENVGQRPARASPFPSPYGPLLRRRFEQASCSDPNNNDETIVVAPNGFCNVVPTSPTTGYVVTCNAAGTGGTYSTCTDTTCGTCGAS